MTFITTLIAILIERFFDCGHIRQWGWFGRWQKWLSARLARLPAYFVLLLVVLPGVLIVGVLNCLLAHWLYGILKIIFDVLILLYCLGPINFWAQSFASISSLQGEGAQVYEPIKNAFGVTITNTPVAFHRAFTEALFCAANQRVFAVLFWFILLGPAGAVLYRSVDICRLQNDSRAAIVLGLLDWLPTRLLAFLFALGGILRESLTIGGTMCLAARGQL